LIKVKNLRKSYGSLEVLKGINLEMHKGEVIAIIGSSGTGKSTFLRCLNYLEIPEEGQIMIDDLTVNAKETNKKEIYELRKKTSMVFQNYNLFENKTALGNIMEPLITVKKMHKRNAKEKALNILKIIGLEDKKDSYPSMLSGGQQQRISIGRAMGIEPKVMLFDEPTSALDPELTGEVLDLIKSLARNHTTMIIVTHEIDFAREAADRIIFMDEGKFVEEGSPDKILNFPENPRTIQFLKKAINNR